MINHRSAAAAPQPTGRQSPRPRVWRPVGHGDIAVTIVSIIAYGSLDTPEMPLQAANWPRRLGVLGVLAVPLRFLTTEGTEATEEISDHASHGHHNEKQGLAPGPGGAITT